MQPLLPPHSHIASTAPHIRTTHLHSPPPPQEQLLLLLPPLLLFHKATMVPECTQHKRVLHPLPLNKTPPILNLRAVSRVLKVTAGLPPFRAQLAAWQVALGHLGHQLNLHLYTALIHKQV